MRSLTERVAQGECFVIMRHNRPVGALIAYEDLVPLIAAARGFGAPARVRR